MGILNTLKNWLGGLNLQTDINRPIGLNTLHLATDSPFSLKDYRPTYSRSSAPNIQTPKKKLLKTAPAFAYTPAMDFSYRHLTAYTQYPTFQKRF